MFMIPEWIIPGLVWHATVTKGDVPALVRGNRRPTAITSDAGMK